MLRKARQPWAAADIPKLIHNLFPVGRGQGRTCRALAALHWCAEECTKYQVLKFGAGNRPGTGQNASSSRKAAPLRRSRQKPTSYPQQAPQKMWVVFEGSEPLDFQPAPADISQDLLEPGNAALGQGHDQLGAFGIEAFTFYQRFEVGEASLQ